MSIEVFQCTCGLKAPTLVLRVVILSIKQLTFQRLSRVLIVALGTQVARLSRSLFKLQSFAYTLLKQANLAPSTSEALRLVDGGGVRIDGATVVDRSLKLGAGTYVVQVGKRKFARVTLA